MEELLKCYILTIVLRLTMLGDLIYEGKGKVTGQRVLDTEEGVAKLEVSISGSAKSKRVDITEMWTYWTIPRTDGVLYGEGRGIIMTKNGTEVATATGYGISTVIESGKRR